MTPKKVVAPFCLLLALCPMRRLAAERVEVTPHSFLRHEAVESLVADSQQSNQARPEDPWLAPDKLRHLTTSIVLTAACYEGYDRAGHRTSQARSLAALSTLGLGLLKEERDRRRTHFSWKDLVADIVGITIGVLVFTY